MIKENYGYLGVVLVYLDVTVRVHVTYYDLYQAASTVFVNGEEVMYPVVNSPEAFIARNRSKSVGGETRRGLVLGLYKRSVGGGTCPALKRLGTNAPIQTMLRRAGWDGTRELLIRNTVSMSVRNPDLERYFPDVLMPGVFSKELKETLGSGWSELRGTVEARRELDRFIRNFHNVMYNI